MTNLDSIFKSRDITLPTKVHVVKAMVFPVFMYGCESWTVKKAEHRRIDAFELWCWRRLLSGHLMRRVDSLEKTLMLGGIGGRRRRGRQRMRWLDGITDLMDTAAKRQLNCRRATPPTALLKTQCPGSVVTNLFRSSTSSHGKVKTIPAAS